MTDYDVIVVGGGSSGLMATINAASQGARTLLIEKNPKLGRKLLLSGGGRCNVTNRTTREDLITHIPGNGKFLYSALNQFDQEDIIHFFEDAGVELKEEDHGRMFPVTDRARTILDTLVDKIEALDVTIMMKESVESLIYDRQAKQVQAIQTASGQTITAKSIILASGGRAYPKTGATGDAYAWAKSAGHTIERLYPTEAPLLSDDRIITEKLLRGVSLRDVNVTVWNGEVGQKPIVHHQMDMIFTHFGYSGPAILRCSGHVNQYLHATGEDICHLSIDLIPNETVEQLQAVAEESRDRQTTNILKQWMPERMAEVVCSLATIDGTKAYKQLIHSEVEALWTMVKTFPLTAHGSQPIEKGFVTGGGVSTKEVDPKTMESKLMNGLYFCGELLDINGYTGGYNITAAFVTGTIAGQYAAWNSFG
ncbi:NAD(P)/FAD-dependent oxidoreductase [Aerococcaceae bacterium WGS1372]